MNNARCYLIGKQNVVFWNCRIKELSFSVFHAAKRVGAEREAGRSEGGGATVLRRHDGDALRPLQNIGVYHCDVTATTHTLSSYRS